MNFVPETWILAERVNRPERPAPCRGEAVPTTSPTTELFNFSTTDTTSDTTSNSVKTHAGLGPGPFPAYFSTRTRPVICQAWFRFTFAKPSSVMHVGCPRNA